MSSTTSETATVSPLASVTVSLPALASARSAAARESVSAESWASRLWRTSR
jgi:hypothetical protein